MELPAGYNAYMWQMNNSSDGVNVSGAEAIRRAHPATTVWCKRSALHVVHKTSRLSHKGLSGECFEHISERQLRRASSRDRSLSPKCSQEGRRGGTSSGHIAAYTHDRTEGGGVAEPDKHKCCKQWQRAAHVFFHLCTVRQRSHAALGSSLIT